MPGVVSLAPPVLDVLPQTLSTAFTREMEYAALVNTYAGGESQREVLVLNCRRRWKLTKRLTPTRLIALRDFYDAHKGQPFYFYDPYLDAASQPIAPVASNYDATGANTLGRFAVRFEGAWSQSMGLARGEVTVELVELAGSLGASGFVPGAMA